MYNVYGVGVHCITVHTVHTYYYYIFAKKKTDLLHVFVFTILYLPNIHWTNLKTET